MMVERSIEIYCTFPLPILMLDTVMTSHHDTISNWFIYIPPYCYIIYMYSHVWHLALLHNLAKCNKEFILKISTTFLMSVLVNTELQVVCIIGKNNLIWKLTVNNDSMMIKHLTVIYNYWKNLIIWFFSYRKYIFTLQCLKE